MQRYLAFIGSVVKRRRRQSPRQELNPVYRRFYNGLCQSEQGAYLIFKFAGGRAPDGAFACCLVSYVSQFLGGLRG
jgi:hypothetical protein